MGGSARARDGHARRRAAAAGATRLTRAHPAPLQSVKTKRKFVQQIDSERAVRGGRELHLTYRTSDAHPIPAILLLPDATVPAPAAVLVHGYTSRKAHVAEPVGKALLARGIASLSLDLPLHGTRSDPVQKQSMFEPTRVATLWRQALADVRLGLRYAAAREEIDAHR